MDYEKKYNEALEHARAEILANPGLRKTWEEIFPELAESEDERIRKHLIEFLKEAYSRGNAPEECAKWLVWLDGQKEQKPASTEDMPYITDEHFYEREPADSFKYKLAEYMTKCCTKKEGPYGYTYGISAESILEMAKEELIKRGELQKPVEFPLKDKVFSIMKKLNSLNFMLKLGSNEERLVNEITSEVRDLADYPTNKPAEWSEEDEKMKERLITRLNWITNNTRTDGTSPNITFFDEIAWLKSLRPQPKVELSEDVKKTLNEVSHILVGLSYKQIAKDYKQAIEKLLSLRPSWKPSEEQMEALEYVICDYREDSCNATANYLQEILDHLKNM